MDLSTDYMGLKLKHPIIASSSPLSETLEGIKTLEDCGASAIVMYSLFEEQIRRENEAFDFFWNQVLKVLQNQSIIFRISIRLTRDQIAILI